MTNKKVKTETVEEFLARGGKVNQAPVRVEVNYDNKLFEKQLHDFYQSKEWKELRNSVKEELTPMCIVCGAEEELHVDHINPVRFFWEQRLCRDNLQILCKDCNLEKGSIKNWNLEWHIKNKGFLSSLRESKDFHIDRLKKRKKIEQDNLTAYSGLEVYQINELNSSFTRYINLCHQHNIQPVSKTRFRRFIEMQIPSGVENVWFYSKEIKRYTKDNFKKIQ